MKVRLGLALFISLLSGSLVVAQNTKEQLNNQLFEAARAGDAALVASLLDKGADVNAKFRYGATALFKAAERGHANVVKLLLERGADATIQDTYYGATAMTWALDKGHAEVVKLLLDKVPNAANDVLLTGTREGNADLVRAALAKTITPANLTAALIIASDGEPKTQIIELLKVAGAKPAMVLPDPVLESYVGKYKTENGTEITITRREGGMLFASSPGQNNLRLFPLDEKTFRPPAFEQMRVVFETEGNKATGFALIQGPNTSKFKRIE
jgi:ankyrin repeat protein